MIEAVMVFGLINVVFEFIVLSLIPPWTRLRLLGNSYAQLTFHIVIMCFVLWIHWGTLTGTMSGFFSFILSIVTMFIAKVLFGFVRGGVYRRGIVGYKKDELV